MTMEQKKNNWRRIVMSLACVVVFWTVYALILPASTLTKTEKVLACPVDIHTHTDECYDENGNLRCGKADYVVHMHEADCFDESGNVVCQLPQILEHEHTEDCYAVEQIVQCGLEEHTHTEECYEWHYLCEDDEEHEHTEECEKEAVLICEDVQHVHTEECCETEKILVCTETEIALHTHSDECCDEDQNLICGRLETGSHQHGNGCFETVRTEIADDSNEDVNEAGTYTQRVEEIEIIAQNSAEEEDESVELEKVAEDVEDLNTAAEVQETAEINENTSEEETAEETSWENTEETSPERAEETSQENAEEASQETAEEISSEAESEIAAAQEIVEEEVRQEVIIRTYTGRDFAITVQTTQEAEIPLNSVLNVEEIMPGTEDYAVCYQAAAASLTTEEQQMVFARFYDISFVVNGEEVEPKAPVSVVIAYQNRVEVPEGEQNVVHFDNVGNAQSVEVNDPAASSVAEDAFAQTCYSEENAFAFEADSFSVYGTTIVRTFKSGKIEALCAERKITSQLNNGRTDIEYTLTMQPDHEGVTYEISTKSDVETGTLIPVVGPNGTDGVSLYSPELQVKKNDQVLATGACFNNLYCYDNVNYTLVAFLKPEGDDRLVPYDKDGNQLNGTLYMAHDVDTVKVEWGVKNISVVIDADMYNSGTSKQDSIIRFDVIGTNGENNTVADAYKVEFLGYPNDVFRLSDYFVGDEFYYRQFNDYVNGNSTGYTENPLWNENHTWSNPLTRCYFVKIVANNGGYEMQPCDSDGNAVSNATLYVITDTQYRFSFVLNNMVKEHAEDDGQAYFWAGTDFVLGNSLQSRENTRHSIEDSTVNFTWDNRTYQLKIDDIGLLSTAINQERYYITGRIGESMLPSEASKNQPVDPGQTPAEPMTAILYAATGSETTAVDAAQWDDSWHGTHDYNLVHQESYPGWHTKWMDVGAHASDKNGWRGYNYFIRDYLVLDSSWDKVVNFIITEENGNVVLNVQKYEEKTLFPITKEQTHTLRKPSSGERSDSGNDLVGYGSGNTAIQLVYARPGLITQRWYKSGLPATVWGTLPTYATMDHVQLRVNTNIVIDINDVKYEGSFLYVSGAVSPYGRSSTSKWWRYLIPNTRGFTDNLENARGNDNNWVTLPIANSQESQGQDLQTGVVPQGFESMWNSELISIAIKYKLAGVLKPIDPITGIVNTDPDTWILYCDNSFSSASYQGDPVAEQVLKDIRQAQNASGSIREPYFEYSTTLDSAQLQQATYACPRTAGYDVILDVNAAFKEVFSSLPKIVVTKQWKDAGYEAYRPDEITVTIERHKKGTADDVWETFKDLTFSGIMNDFNWVGSYVLKPDENPGAYDTYRIQPGSERMTWNGDRANDVHYTYETTYDGLYVTNKAVNPYVEMNGYKIWVNSKGEAMVEKDIPESIVLNLYQSEKEGKLGLLYDSRIVKKIDQQNKQYWYWEFGRLEKYYVGEDGKLHEYAYTIAEVRATDEGGYEVLHEYSGNLAVGQYQNESWTTINDGEVMEGNGNTFGFINRRKPVISFRKVDPDGKPLQGAVFTLKEQGSDSVLYSFTSDANGYLIRQDDNGKVRTVELSTDKTYILTETQAPVGYTILTNQITISYDSDQKKWICVYVDNDNTSKYIKTEPSKDGDLLTISVINIGITLPETGGIGTKAMTVVGAIMLIVSSLMLIGLRKKRRCE